MKILHITITFILLWAFLVPRLITVIDDYSVIGKPTSCGLYKEYWKGFWEWEFDWQVLRLYATSNCDNPQNDEGFYQNQNLDITE